MLDNQQEINNSVSKDENYAFIDLHMHTKHSHEDGCDITVEELLESCLKKIKNDQKCCISITDHNSINGVRKARTIIEKNPEKYKNINLINGVEFTTDLCELRQFYGDFQVFSRCHILCYDYDVNDPQLDAYSKITHKNFGSRDKIGLQILALRRTLCEKFNIYIPFTTLLPLTELNREDNITVAYKNLVGSYVGEKYSRLKIKNVLKEIENFRLNPYDENEKAKGICRLKLSEVAKLIKDAGGKMVLAHPSIIRMKKNDKAGLSRIGKEYLYVKRNKNLIYLKEREKILDELINNIEKVCGYKLYGLEAFFPAGMYESGKILYLQNIARNKNLNITCGSDFHGYNMSTEKEVGDVLGESFQQKYKQKSGYRSIKNTVLTVSNISGIINLKQNLVPCDYKLFVRDDKQFFSNLDFDSIASIKKQDISVDVEPKDQNEVLLDIPTITHDIANRTKNLVQTAEMLERITKDLKTKKKTKTLININKYIETVFSGMQQLSCKYFKYQEVQETPAYLSFIESHDRIKFLYKKILQDDPDLLKNLKNDKRSKNNNTSYLCRLVNLHVKPRQEDEREI